MNVVFDAPSSSRPDLSVAVRTLITGGFVLEDVQRKPGYALLYLERPDEFGASQRYCFALAEDNDLSSAQVEGARIAADHHHAQLVLIGHSETDMPAVEWMRFINLFGGPVLSVNPLEPGFVDHLNTLAYNQLPNGIQGQPDDLFEAYVRSALEFILGGRVVRYGQDRRFEARPDGIALPIYGFSALYDTKAYSNGYEVTLDTIRQFKSYVEDFTRRYDAYLPRLNAFIVISGCFPHKDSTLGDRSRSLLSECGVPLAFLTSESLGAILAMLSKHPAARRSINWSRIFTEPVVRPEDVVQELEAIVRDDIVRR